jgi:hypothetical protein
MNSNKVVFVFGTLTLVTDCRVANIAGVWRLYENAEDITERHTWKV